MTMTNLLNQTPIRALIPLILLAGLLLLGFMVMRDFLLALTWALILAYVMWPPYCFLKRRLHDRATLSAAIMTAMITATVLLTTFWLAAMLQDETKIAYQTLAKHMTHGSYQLPPFILEIPWLGHYLQDGVTRLTSDEANLSAQLLDWAKQWLGEIALLLGGFGRYVLKLGVILVTVFFCFRNGKEAMDQLQRGLIHFLGEDQHVYLQAAGDTTRAVVYGLVLAALGQGILAGIGYAVAGVDAPVLLGVVTAILALIPMGATLVWLPVGITLIINNQFWPGAGLLLWGFMAVSTVDNVIRPLVISGAGQVPFLVVLFGVLGGLSAFGAIGLFLGPVILSVLLAVWDAWLKQQDSPEK